MELISAICGAIALFALLYYCLDLRSRSARSKINAPEAGGARLFTGHLHLLMSDGSGTDLPHFKLSTLADKYGPVFTIRIGVHRALVVNSMDVAKELFTACDIAISSRPETRGMKHLGHDSFGFAPYGSYWRELRKLVNQELLSSRRVELQNHVRVSETEQSIKELYKLWEEKKDGTGRALVDMKQWFGDLNLNVIMRLVVGKRFYGGGGGGSDTTEMRRCREVFRDFFYLVGLFVPADALPYLAWLDIGGYEKRMKENSRKVDEIVGGWLAEHRKKEYSGDDKPQDFMDVMLSVIQDTKFEGQYDTDAVIKSTCENLIIGGSDTASLMLVWALSLLLNNRRALKKAQEELDSHVGTERRVNESDINKLVYLQAIIKETLRLYSGPLIMTREFYKDTIVKGHHIPKGTRLIINSWRLHRDPQVWSDDPLEFRPERFLTTNKNIDVKGLHFELIPFGAGRRICPGANFALQMMVVILANLLQAFEVSTVSDGKVDMTESAGLTNNKQTPLDVLVAPRLSPSLY